MKFPEALERRLDFAVDDVARSQAKRAFRLSFPHGCDNYSVVTQFEHESLSSNRKAIMADLWRRIEQTIYDEVKKMSAELEEEAKRLER